MTNTKYKFIVTFKDDTKREYYATSYATLYEYFLLTPHLDYSIDDIDNVELIREFYYTSLSRGVRCRTEINESEYNQYTKLFQKNYDTLVKHNIDNVDMYIRVLLSMNR